MHTNAVCASNLFLLSISKNVVNETNVTYSFYIKVHEFYLIFWTNYITMNGKN